ncbi:MAG: hypothetical protein ABIU96_03135 [Rhodanobacter sp.]
MSSVTSLGATQAGNDVFARILGASSGLVVLDSEDPRATIGQFRALARRTGQAVYLWEPMSGLSSLRDVHARFPDCQRIGSALRHVRQSLHFGVYFLVGLELPLSAADAALLRQLARESTEHLRRVVLVSPPVALVEELGALAVHLHQESSSPRHLRMRDGRWLVEG